MKSILFIKEFLKNWREVGSIVPSSRFLIQKIIESMDFSKADIVVELGPGLGSVTRELLRNMKQNGKLIVFEKNENFCRQLEKIKDARLIVYNESVFNLEKQLAGTHANYVISSVPLANFTYQSKHDLLAAVHRVLLPQGRFVQFQYSLESRTDLKKIFDKVCLNFTPLNIPPAFIYSCVKK